MPKNIPFNKPFSPSLALAISPSDILDSTRARFGDLRMEATDDGKGGDKDKGGDGDKPTDDKAKPEDGKDTKTDDADKLGDAGKRALNAERDAREKAEKETKALREQVDGFFGGLKTLLGGDDGKNTKPEELIENLANELTELKRTNLVEAVARRHKITDEDDLDMLRAAKDDEAMEKLAKRLAPSDQEQGDDKGKGKGRTPRPDGSQGKGGGGSAGRSKSVAEVMAERAAAREAKK